MAVQGKTSIATANVRSRTRPIWAKESRGKFEIFQTRICEEKKLGFLSNTKRAYLVYTVQVQLLAKGDV